MPCQATIATQLVNSLNQDSDVSKLITRASSINRALDQIGDKWCLLILQKVFWGTNSFNDMIATIGVSRGVLSDRLKWLQSVDCLHKKADSQDGKRMRYHLTRKSLDLYNNALMAFAWARQFSEAPDRDTVELVHLRCGHAFNPQMCCAKCRAEVRMQDVSYRPGPGAMFDERTKKARRRSSIPVQDVPSGHALYHNLINLVGDRWTANVIALSFHGLTRFDEFIQELPVATNILSDRLKFLVDEGVYWQRAYRQRPLRYEYKLTEKGEALYPWFLALLQWGDKWCSPDGSGKPRCLRHKLCGHVLRGQVSCSACGGVLKAHEVKIEPGPDTIP